MADEFRPAVDLPDFFDWASTAPVSVAAAAAMDAFARQHTHTSNPPDFLTQATGRADLLRTMVRSAFGARSADEVVLVRSVAEGASVLAAGYPIGPESSIVVTAADHEAAVAPWLRRAQASGAELRTVPLDTAGGVDLTSLERAVDGRTAIVCLSHVSHLDGIRQPIREAVAITRSRSAGIVVVDGAQAVGRVPVSMADLDADIYLAGGRKALLAPIGSAFMLGRADVLSRVDPHVLSTRNTRVELNATTGWELHEYMRELPASIEGNLPDLRCIEGLRASIAAYMSCDPDEHIRLTLDLTRHLASNCARLGISILSPLTANQTGILRVAVGGGIDHLAIKKDLANAGLYVAAAQDWLRVSLLPFNSSESIVRLAEGMTKAAHRQH